MLKNSHLFESIPTAFIKGAFLDRIHLYNPGWEIRTLKKDSFSKGYGLITDYIAAVLHELRNHDLTDKLKEYAKFDGSLSERDHLAIRKTFSGMLKLLYPDGNVSDQEAYELIDFATESRKRVKDQLYLIDETFRNEPAIFKYERLKEHGEIKTVDTLERINNNIGEVIEDQPTTEGDEDSKESSTETQPSLGEVESESDKTTKPKRRRVADTRQKTLSFRMGQTGVTYEKLFAPYLAKAKEIIVEDPYVRASWQVKNFLEFMTMLIDSRESVEGLKVKLYTSEEDEKIPELIDRLDDIKDDMVEYGIDFEYSFRDFHDRAITTDDGWRIVPGRGLDIYEKYSPYSVAATRQDRRKCKEFSVDYVRVDGGHKGIDLRKSTDVESIVGDK